MAHRPLRLKRRWPRSTGARAAIVTALLLAVPVVLAVVGVVVGLLVAALAIVLAVGPWLALGLGGWYLWRRSVRRAHSAYIARQWAQIAQQQQTQTRPPPIAPAGAAPDPLATLPQEQRAQVDRICRKAQALLRQPARFAAGSRSLHLVQRTLDEYLPSTVNSYLALGSGADDWVIAPDGRTALQVLRDQLGILEAQLDEVASDLWQRDVQRLLANERFLEEHFGRRRPDELTIGGRGERTA